MNKNKRTLLILAGAALVIAGAVAGYFFFFSGESVEVATAKRSNLEVKTNAPGKVEALNDVAVFPEAPGIIESISVADGAQVVAGQEIVRLKEEPLKLQLKEAQSALAQAKAASANVNYQKSARTMSIEAAESALSSAKKARSFAINNLTDARAQLDTAEDNLEKLLSREATQGLDSASSAVATAKAAVSSAEAAELETRAQVEQAEIAVKQAKNLPLGTEAKSASAAGILAAEEAVAFAQKALDNAVLYAPSDGTVIFTTILSPLPGGPSSQYVAGSAVSPQASIFSIVSDSQLGFKAEVDESSIAEITTGQKVEVSLDAFSGKKFIGTVNDLATMAEGTLTGGNIFKVEISIDDAGEELRLGMKGDAEISVKTIDSVLVIPLNCYFTQGKSEFVYRVVDSKLEKVEVETGVQNDDFIEVTSGLNEGDKLVIAGETALKDGMRVKIVEE